MVELAWAAGCRPCVEKLRTALPLTVGIRDSALQLVSTLGSAVISARALWGDDALLLPSVAGKPIYSNQCWVCEKGEGSMQGQPGSPVAPRGLTTAATARRSVGRLA